MDTHGPEMAEPALVVGLDADDTLWDNESYFAATEDRFRELMAPWLDGPETDKQLISIESANVAIYGYGVKGFVLSMIEAALAISHGEVSSSQIESILDWGRELLTVPAVLLPGVEETVRQLAGERRTLIITKGDLHHQQQRVEASGLGSVVDAVEIVAEKDADTYTRVLGRHNIDPHHFVMVGNSVKSDVLPLRAIGAQAIHIPFHVTWALEQAEPQGEPDWFVADSIAEVPGILATLEATR